MTPKRRHPGATGVGPPQYFELSDSQRAALNLYREWCADDDAWTAFVTGIEAAVRIYLQTKQVAEKSSAGAVRSNLAAAVAAGERFLQRLNGLDGNSLMLLSEVSGGRDTRRVGAQLLSYLRRAQAEARSRYPLRGPRPRDERDQLAALILDEVLRHTRLQPTATEGKPFEMLLKLALAFAHEHHADLHRLAARALRGVVSVERWEGVVSLGAPNRE